MDLPYQPPQPLTGEQEFLSLLLVASLWWFINRVHSNWNGAQSTAHYEQQQKQQPPSLISDTLLFLHPSQNRALLAVYNPANQIRLTALEGSEESLVWHEQARDLIKLSNRSYDFSDEEWHDQIHSWIGIHKGTGETVVLACRETQPDAMQLKAIFNYADKVRRNKDRNGNSMEFILALKNGDMDEQSQLAEYPLRTVSESRLLDSLVNFDDYFRDLHKRVEKDTLTGSNLTLEKVYTVSRYKLDKEGGARPDLETFLNNWLDESGLRQIALLGEYGQGKSTVSLMLSYHLMQRIQKNHRSARIPILLELRGKSPRNLREDELLSTWAGRYGIDTRALIKLLIAGRLLLIFEGFDEVDLSGDVDARIDHFKIMWGLCYPKTKIIVTGRPNYFLDDTELKAALGIQAPSLERPYCQAVYLAPFDFKEIDHSLRNLDDETRKGIVALAHGNERFYDIVSRPSMLHVVSTLWRTENLAQYGERINSALVMDLFVRHSYERQGSKAQKYEFTPPVGGKAKPAFMALNTRERAYFMEGIATYMLINGLPNQISGRQLEEAVRLLIEVMPEAVSQQADAQGGEKREPLRQRYKLDINPEEVQTILTDVRSSGLLVPDLSRSGSFKFGHKSFMEFLAGKVFAQWSLRKELNDGEGKGVISLVNSLGLKMRHVVQQAEVLAFAVEWIAEKATNQSQAARLLFALLFRQYDFFTKFFGTLCKFCIRCLPHTKTSLIFFNLSKLYMSLTPILLKSSSKYSNNIRKLQHLIELIFFSSMVAFASLIFKEKTFSHSIDPFNFINVTRDITIMSGLIFIFVIGALITETLSQLILGYRKQEEHLIWIRFRIWYAICIAAHLERSAMVGVIGEKALRLLEEVYRKEPRPWTIAESLERLKTCTNEP